MYIFLKKMYYIFFVIIYFCIFCNKTHAIDYYTDNFNQVDNSSWSYYCNYSYSNPSTGQNVLLMKVQISMVMDIFY